ncbi:MAG: sulfite exporter TauE/SafE family protein [Thiohalomonadaceae bacterium]
MLESLHAHHLLYAAAVVGSAYFVRGIAGFGSGLIAIPLLAQVLPLAVVVPAVGLLDYLGSLTHGTRHRTAIRWRELLPLLPFTLLGVLAALYLFHTVDGDNLRRALGVFVLMYAIYTLTVRSMPARGSRLWALPGGGLGGLVGTLFGTGGPFYVIYLGLRGLGKTEFRATIATIFLIDGAARIVGYLGAGFYGSEVLWLAGLALPLMAVGMFLGGRVHTGITQAQFQKAIGVLLLLSGTALVLR